MPDGPEAKPQEGTEGGCLLGNGKGRDPVGVAAPVRGGAADRSYR